MIEAHSSVRISEQRSATEPPDARPDGKGDGGENAPGAIPDAGELSYSEILDRLGRVMRRIAPPWLADKREDLVQVAVMKVMEIARSREKSAVFTSSYLWRVAQSVLIDEIRRARRRSEIALESALVEQKASPDRSLDPERSARSKELGAEVWDCLGRLQESRRRAVTLHLHGNSPAEAAKLLGFETKKVYNLIHRGMEGLRECLRRKELAP